MKKKMMMKQNQRVNAPSTILTGPYLGFVDVSTDAGLSFSTAPFGRGTIRGISVSSTGQYILIGENGVLKSSSDFGTTFASKTASQFFSTSMSADGEYQLGASNGVLVYSNDFGVTFTPILQAVNWRAAIVSSTGQFQVAGQYSGGLIYYSLDYGMNWVLTAAGKGNWQSLGISDDGQRITVVGYGATIRVSTNAGASFVAKTGMTIGLSNYVAMSTDGKYQTSCGVNAYIRVSDDYGMTWVQKIEVGIKSYQGIAMSSDGKTQTVVVGNGYIYVSTDYGVNWNEITSQGIKNYQAVGMSRYLI